VRNVTQIQDYTNYCALVSMRTITSVMGAEPANGLASKVLFAEHHLETRRNTIPHQSHEVSTSAPPDDWRFFRGIVGAFWGTAED